MKLNIATQIGRQVNDKHSALVKAKFDELLAKPRAVVNGAAVDAQTHYDNAENVANGNEAAREYVVTLLKFVLSVRSHQDAYLLLKTLHGESQTGKNGGWGI